MRARRARSTPRAGGRIGSAAIAEAVTVRARGAGGATRGFQSAEPPERAVRYARSEGAKRGRIARRAAYPRKAATSTPPTRTECFSSHREIKATLDKCLGLVGIALPSWDNSRHVVPWRLWDNHQSG